VNRTQGDLGQLNRERDELQRRLAAAQAEADRLRVQLETLPAQQEEAVGWTPVPGGAVIAIEARVLFAPGKVTLRPESLKVLDGIISTLQGEYGDRDVLVFGHTDDRPIKKSGWEDNWQLSTERALAVARYLKDHGVAPERLAAAGCGEHRPVTQNTSEESRTKNRRVAIFAADPELRIGRPAS
jgi:chemotaxis protein MotB